MNFAQFSKEMEKSTNYSRVKGDGFSIMSDDLNRYASYGSILKDNLGFFHVVQKTAETHRGHILTISKISTIYFKTKIEIDLIVFFEGRELKIEKIDQSGFIAGCRFILFSEYVGDEAYVPEISFEQHEKVRNSQGGIFSKVRKRKVFPLYQGLFETLRNFTRLRSLKQVNKTETLFKQG